MPAPGYGRALVGPDGASRKTESRIRSEPRAATAEEEVSPRPTTSAPRPHLRPDAPPGGLPSVPQPSPATSRLSRLRHLPWPDGVPNRRRTAPTRLGATRNTRHETR